MSFRSTDTDTKAFLKSLGFPEIRVHHSFGHFDFSRPARRILVIGPMGSGKTEYSARVWRDAKVAKKKNSTVAKLTTTEGADRRKVFFVRSVLDAARFPDYPDDALAYRGGFERCGESIARISDSFELEKLIEDNPDFGTWIVDEASFYDERLAYVVKNASQKKGLVFIFPSLILNFRKDIFNPTAQLLLDNATDIFPLTAYCEHDDCIEDSFYTYRYYKIGDDECPALYFDPLIVIGGDAEKENSREPNYCTRCDRHHYLPGKEYTFLILKPLGESASRGDIEGLEEELRRIKYDIKKSRLYAHFTNRYLHKTDPQPVNMNALKVDCIAERAVAFLYAEQNLLSGNQVRELVKRLALATDYLEKTLTDNRRPLSLS
ncbi:MAG: thymidine kinase [Spirochaetia bacterium]